MKIFAKAHPLATGCVATSSEGHTASALLRTLRQALSRFRAARWAKPALGGQYEDVARLDSRVLEEIGLTPEQLRVDTSQPVWWR